MACDDSRKLRNETNKKTPPNDKAGGQDEILAEVGTKPGMQTECINSGGVNVFSI